MLASNLVPPDATLQGLAPLREEIEDQLAYLDRARRTWPETAPDRAHLLEVNEIFGEGVLRLQLEWLKEAEKTLRAQG